MKSKAQPDIAERNIALSGQVMRYLLSHPKVFDVLPEKFELVILPEDDPEVTLFNLELLRKYGSEGKPIVFARVKTRETVMEAEPSIFVPVAV